MVSVKATAGQCKLIRDSQWRTQIPTQQFRATTIRVLDTDARYLNRTIGRLNEVWAMPLGQSMIQEITHPVFIRPVEEGGNKCTSGGVTIFYRLRAALRGSNTISVRRELGLSLMGAAASGWTLQRIGYTLAGGLSTVTFRTAGNLTYLDSMNTPARERLGSEIADLIEKIADGTKDETFLIQKGADDRSPADHLLRLL